MTLKLMLLAWHNKIGQVGVNYIYQGIKDINLCQIQVSYINIYIYIYMILNVRLAHGHVGVFSTGKSGLPPRFQVAGQIRQVSRESNS